MDMEVDEAGSSASRPWKERLRTRRRGNPANHGVYLATHHPTRSQPSQRALRGRGSHPRGNSSSSGKGNPSKVSKRPRRGRDGAQPSTSVDKDGDIVLPDVLTSVQTSFDAQEPNFQHTRHSVRQKGRRPTVEENWTIHHQGEGHLSTHQNFGNENTTTAHPSVPKLTFRPPAVVAYLDQKRRSKKSRQSIEPFHRNIPPPNSSSTSHGSTFNNTNFSSNRHDITLTPPPENHQATSIHAWNVPQPPSASNSNPLLTQFRKIIHWWVKQLNDWCDPTLDEDALCIKCDLELESSDIVPNSNFLGQILELAYQRIASTKKALDPLNPEHDLLPFAKTRISKQAEKIFGISLADLISSGLEKIESVSPGHGEQTTNITRSAGQTAEQTKMAKSALLSQFIGLLNMAIAGQNGELLKSVLPIEPPFKSDFVKLIDDVFTRYSDLDSLKEDLKLGIPVAAQDDKDAWQAFPDFLVDWLGFIRTVNVENLLETYDMLSNLIK
jgi:hypothetical protein